ncbi:hypothetical protein HC251_02085 [Iamia sp. SCSIO 61187]|uniref:hypothetical protein n=1 Tax=Iamia sp. SCSIO 61187 TaxID=2722752 RepID=UPI001C62495A|nr:hypothetical protein [Iamia sp. SCSIO 61187]QYG91342.1 hypothetical protein HC251_02085 [Iamia sp. SCSIO 61187]
MTAEAAAPVDARVDRRWVAAGVAVVVALVPMTFLGPGTDLDVGAVIRSGRTIVRDGDYMPSRAPGAPVHEAAVGVLEWVGGTVGPNLGALAAAIALVAVLVVLLRREGVRRVELAVAVVVANPWFLVAATSTVDFLWALALWAGAALVLRSRPTRGGALGAGVLAGLAVGCRSSTAFLVGGLVLAHALEPQSGDPADRAAPWAHALAAGATAALVGLVLYVPSYRAADSSLAFAQNDVPTSTFFVQVGRFLVKDLYFVGPFAAVVLVLALPALGRVLLRWRADWLVRLGLITVVASQLLFLRFPWKMGHLLPTLVGLALLLARALGDRPRVLAALVAAQLLYAVVSITLVQPDNPNAATGGELTFDPAWGALVTDVRCRADDPDAWEGPGVDRLQAVWDCSKPWASG